MDRDLLILLGEATYGPNWKQPLARELGYDRRTVRRWAKGEWPIPKGVVAHLMRIAADRIDILGEFRRTLRELERLTDVDLNEREGLK